MVCYIEAGPLLAKKPFNSLTDAFACSTALLVLSTYQGKTTFVRNYF